MRDQYFNKIRIDVLQNEADIGAMIPEIESSEFGNRIMIRLHQDR